nr:MAG TPA: hypothetical protein [Caudoviricetes sp.]
MLCRCAERSSVAATRTSVGRVVEGRREAWAES